MEQLRQPSVLLAFAAGVLVLNLVVLVTDAASTPAVTVDDQIGAPADAAAGEGDAGGDDGGTAQDGDADAGGQDGAEPGNAEGEQPPAGSDGDAGGDGGDAADGGDGDDGQSDTGDADQGDSGQDGAGDGVLVAPTPGTYQYSSSGEWSLTGGGNDERHQLPATAEGTVTTDGESWKLRLQAGSDYADSFTFRLAADGGLDWTGWVLDRTFDNGGPSSTPYDCTGDSAYFRPDEQGRTVTHTCETTGVRSSGTIEHLGSEDVTLGDGSTVTADRLLYTYTVTGDGVTGEGRLDLWLDPSTGLRVRELREISTTRGESNYREQVDVVLQRATPDA